MVFGRSCSESGRLDGSDGEEGGGGCFGMREYFVLLGLASASSSSKKERSSFSAISSRLRGAEDEALVDGTAGGCGVEVEDALSSFDGDEADVAGQSQPILNVGVELVLGDSEAEDVAQTLPLNLNRVLSRDGLESQPYDLI